MGRLVKFVLRPGNAAECVALPDLIGAVATQELIADKAYDTVLLHFAGGRQIRR